MSTGGTCSARRRGILGRPISPPARRGGGRRRRRGGGARAAPPRAGGAGQAADRAGGVQRDLRGDGEAGSQAADREGGVAMTPKINRREFVATGAGLVISFYLPARRAAAPGPTDAGFAPNAWLRIGA